MEPKNPSIPVHHDPEADTSRNFNALKNLKETEDQYQLLKNRIKILQLNEERNVRKLHNSQIQIERIQMVRNQAHSNQNNLSQLKKMRLESLQQRKIKNKDLKESIIKQTKANFQSLHSQKSQNYQYLTKQSKTNHMKIQSVKLQNISRRKEQHEAIAEAEERSKQNIMEYALRKNRTIYEQQAKQNQYLAKKRQKKLQEIQNLQKVEMQMLKRSSESHQAFKCVKNRLDQMLGRIKNEQSCSKKKLNGQEKTNGRSESFYILNSNHVQPQNLNKQ